MEKLWKTVDCKNCSPIPHWKTGLLHLCSGNWQKIIWHIIVSSVSFLVTFNYKYLHRNCSRKKERTGSCSCSVLHKDDQLHGLDADKRIIAVWRPWLTQAVGKRILIKRLFWPKPVFALCSRDWTFSFPWRALSEEPNKIKDKTTSTGNCLLVLILCSSIVYFDTFSDACLVSFRIASCLPSVNHC